MFRRPPPSDVLLSGAGLDLFDSEESCAPEKNRDVQRGGVFDGFGQVSDLQ
jgi:hypothetical protein